MKRTGYLLLAVVLSGSGCLPPDAFLQTDTKPPRVEMKEAPPPPAVTPDSVSDKNAVEKAQSLRAELEHELRRNSTPAVETPSMP